MNQNAQKGFVQIVFIFFVALFALIILIIKYYGYSPYKISNPNMEPTVGSGQFWMVRRNNPQFKRQDMVVFKIPQSQYTNLGRIIGLPGETIEIKNQQVYINNAPLTESYLPTHPTTSDGEMLQENKSQQIPANKYVILADNRTKGFDSRDYGFIDRSAIIGKLAFCYRYCSTSDTIIDASFDRQLDKDAILSLVNNYRIKNKRTSWTTNQELCDLAQARVKYLADDHLAALKQTSQAFQKTFQDQVKSYSGAFINEIDAFDQNTNQQVVNYWINSSTNRAILVQDQIQNIPIVNACAAVKMDRGYSVVVLLTGSALHYQPPASQQKTNSNAAQQTQSASESYTIDDVNSLVANLNQADKDNENMKSFIGVSTYNQQTVNKIISLIAQRKVLVQTLLNKMSKNQPLNAKDIATWNEYGQLSAEQDELVKSLANGNGGF